MLLGLGFAVSHASAASMSLGYSNITNDTSFTGSQLRTDVDQGPGNSATFTFYNDVGDASSITDVYFADSILAPLFKTTAGNLLQSQITDSGLGVDFSFGANPSALPGQNGATPPFVTTIALGADSNPPTAPNGVSTSTEWLAITLNIVDGKIFSDVLTALSSGVLRLGLHVQAIASGGGSDSFVSNPPSAVPVPAALPLFATALAGIGLLRYRSRRNRA